MSRPRFSSLLVAVLALLVPGQAARAAPPAGVSGKMVCPDAELIASVKKAERGGVTPQAVEAFVGREAVINTLRDDPAILLCAKGIEADAERLPRNPRWEDLPPIPKWDEAKCVVYWCRPLDEKNPRMVGVVWDQRGVPRVFFCVVPPP